MAIFWLGGAVLLTLLSGFLIGRESAPFFATAIAVMWAGAAAYVIAVIWSGRASSGERTGRWWAVATAGRTLLGLAVGMLGFGFAAVYGDGVLSPYGEQVTAEITEVSEVCHQNSTVCHPNYRLAVADDDLGWVLVCGSGGPVGTKVEVDIDPLGQREPIHTSCIPGRNQAPWITALWLGGVGTIGLVIVADSGWRAARSRGSRLPDNVDQR